MNISRSQLANWAILVGVVVRLGYWFYVEPIWEDALITLRIIGNFVNSGRLSYNPPEVVYGFTSPLHALLVILPGEVATPGGGILVSRITSLLAFGATIRLALKLAQHPAYDISLRGFGLWLLLLVCYMPGIYFPMGGMETQFTVLAVFAAITHCANRDDVPLGVWLGIALLTRPDMIILSVVCLGVRFLGSPRTAIRAGLIACAVYGPWFIFSWIYFGNPIPQTVIAKSLQSPEYSLRLWWFVKKIYSPTTSESMEGNLLLDIVVLLPVLLILSSIPLLWLSANKADSLEKTRSFLSSKIHLFAGPLFVIGFYSYMTVFMAHCPWYHVPVFLLSGFLFALTIDRFAERVQSKNLSAYVTGLLCLGIALPHLVYAAAKPLRDHLVQIYIENGIRIPIGLWLKENVPQGERVYLEPLGYIGYYAGPAVIIDDWPGLISRRTTAVLRSLPSNERTEVDPVRFLRPDWIVIRQKNYKLAIGTTGFAAEELRERYEIVEEFGISGLAPSHFFLQNNMDAFFYVLRRV